MNLMNKGYTAEEISEMIKLPPELDRSWPARGYYEAMAKGALTIEGRRGAFTEFMGLLDTFPFWFNIVTP